MNTAVETVNLTKYFKGDGGKERIVAVNYVNLSIREGEFFGLLGPNGAGKTTLIKILCTLVIPDEGTAKVAGFDVVKDAEKVRECIGWLHGETGGRALYWRLSARDNLRFYAYLQNIPPDIARKRIDALLEFFELSKDADRLVKDFSTGMKMRVMLARTLLSNAPILLMDEPTVGLDATGAIETRRLLQALCKELRKTIVFTTHNIFEAERLCDRIAVMSKGKVIAVDTPLRLSEITRKYRGVEVRFRGSSEEAVRILEGLEFVKRIISVQPEEDYTVIRAEVKDEEQALSEIPKAFGANRLRTIGVQIALPSLEEVFLSLTGGEHESA
ncbi:MAG: ABC transporter ATP-binding protein [Thermoproteota archaeon]